MANFEKALKEEKRKRIIKKIVFYLGLLLIFIGVVSGKTIIAIIPPVGFFIFGLIKK